MILEVFSNAGDSVIEGGRESIDWIGSSLLQNGHLTASVLCWFPLGVFPVLPFLYHSHLFELPMCVKWTG